MPHVILPTALQYKRVPCFECKIQTNIIYENETMYVPNWTSVNRCIHVSGQRIVRAGFEVHQYALSHTDGTVRGYANLSNKIEILVISM